MNDTGQVEAENAKILIVEDSPTQAIQLQFLLEEQGYEVTVATDGQAGYKAACERKPSLVISDIVMPVMNGYELCRAVKEDRQLMDVPVILLTSLTEPEDIIRGLQAGADHYVTKPYEDEHLLSKVDYALTTLAPSAGQEPVEELEISCGGSRHVIRANRRQILNLLLSTYEAAVRQNRELSRIQLELTRFNEQLEERIQRRTAELQTANEQLQQENMERERAEAHYRLLAENSTDLIARHAIDGTYLYASPASTALLGYTPEELVGRSIYELSHSDDADTIRRDLTAVLTYSEPVICNARIRRKDGQYLWFETTCRAMRSGTDSGQEIITVSRDITERRMLEAQLQQSQKMEAIGQLAGGVAHDFNNMLTIILGYTDIRLLTLASDDPMRRELEEVHKAGERAAALTRQLLTFSRRQVLQPQVLGLNDLVTNLTKMLRRLIGEDIELETTLAPDTWLIKADPGQLEQVIMNLVVNAADAMPIGGRLTIETDNMDLDETYTRRHVGVSPGSYVMLAVSDTGCGMDAETQAHIFEPFFTTKEQGKGTGLGLATVYGIVTQSNGTIWVYSEPGKGTTFKIYLPRNEESVKSSKAGEGYTALPRGTETILLVEDDKSVQQLAIMVLQQQGYTVIPAQNGIEALEVMEQQKNSIHLVLTDVVMPQMNGREMSERLRVLYPDLKILYMSGYTDDAIVRHGILETGMPFLQKPFTPYKLTHKVRDVLDEIPT